jgi:hypothetical protein
VISGICRTIYLYRTWNVDYDVAWEIDKTWIATIIELDLAIIAASAPALKVFVELSVIKPASSLYHRARSHYKTGSGDSDSTIEFGIRPRATSDDVQKPRFNSHHREYKNAI